MRTIGNFEHQNLFCFDECTDIQALEHIAQPTPAGSNHPKSLEVEYIKHSSITEAGAYVVDSPKEIAPKIKELIVD